MPSVFDRFNKNIVGSNNLVYDYIPVIDASGDFKKLDGIDAIVYGWNVILNTPTGTVDHDPRFGCDLYKMVFEPIDEVTQENIISTIRDQLLAYDPRAIIKNISITFSKSKLSYNVTVDVKYRGEDRVINKTVNQQNIPEF